MVFTVRTASLDSESLILRTYVSLVYVYLSCEKVAVGCAELLQADQLHLVQYIPELLEGSRRLC